MFILSARDGEAHEGITGISLEIHAHIQSFIEPSDIISLRQTCRYLYDATHQREVWKSALRRVCISQGLFMPSFPMEQMSMEELENAALGPLRFSSMLTSRSPDSLPKPHKTRIIEFRSATAGKFGEFQRFDFIPGGRYLITQFDHALLFWDLGANISVNRTLPLNPIASLPIDTAFKVSGFGCGPTTDGLGILLFVVKDPTTAYQRTSDVSVHVIHPLSSTPEFVHVASLNGIRFRQLRWAWTDSLFVFSTYPSGYVTVWNFRDDSILSWDHKFPQVFDIAVCEGHIIIYQPGSFSLYTIPPLHQRRDADDIDASVMNEPYPPVAEIACNMAGVPYQEGHSVSSHWMAGRADQHLLGLVGEDWDARPVIDYYIWDKSDKSKIPNIPTSVPLLADSSFSTPLPERHGFPVMRFCDRYITQLWLNSDQLFLILSPIPIETVATRGDFGWSFKVIRLWELEKAGHDLSQMLDYALCPATGRLCVLTRRPSELLVVDYTAPY